MRLIGFVLSVVVVTACGSSSPVAPTPVIPQIAGQWTGTHTTTACSETGSAIGTGVCIIGRVGGLTFTANQTAGSLSGTLGIGAFNLPVSGNIDGNGTLSLTGVSDIGQGFTITLNRWQGNISGSTMSGTMAFTLLNTFNPIGSSTANSNFTLSR